MIKLSRWQIGHGIFLINPRRLWQELWLALIFITFFQLSECVVRDCPKIILKSLHCAWLPLPKYFDIVKLGWQVLLKYLMNMFYFFHCTKIVIWVVRWWKSNWKVCMENVSIAQIFRRCEAKILITPFILNDCFISFILQ